VTFVVSAAGFEPGYLSSRQSVAPIATRQTC